MRDFNTITIATINGIINTNLTNNSADSTYSAGVGTTNANPTQAISATHILNAAQTMGDRNSMLKILMVHSVIATNLKIANLITFIPNARGEVNIPTYLGLRLIESDTLPVVSLGGGNYSYTSYLSAPGLLAFAEHPPEKAVETFRTPSAGNGTGMETLYTRRQFALHPMGYHWTENTVTEMFPSNTELELAANWTRKFPERKQIPFVAIRSLNG